MNNRPVYPGIGATARTWRNEHGMQHNFAQLLGE